MVPNREKVEYILKHIETATAYDGFEAWCTLNALLWKAVSQGTHVISELYMYACRADGCGYEWWEEKLLQYGVKAEDYTVCITADMIKLQKTSDVSISKSKQIADIYKKKYLIAFDNVNEVPSVIIDGAAITAKVHISYEWNTRGEEPYGARLKIKHFERDSMNKLLEKTILEKSII